MPGMQSALPEVPTPTIWLQQTQITIQSDLITAKTLGEQRSRSSVSRHSSCCADQLTEEGVRIKMSLLLSNRSVLTILSRVACHLFKQASLFKQRTTLQAPLGWIRMALPGNSTDNTRSFSPPHLQTCCSVSIYGLLNFLCGAKHLSTTAETRFI